MHGYRPPLHLSLQTGKKKYQQQQETSINLAGIMLDTSQHNISSLYLYIYQLTGPAKCIKKGYLSRICCLFSTGLLAVNQMTEKYIKYKLSYPAKIFLSIFIYKDLSALEGSCTQSHILKDSTKIDPQRFFKILQRI